MGFFKSIDKQFFVLTINAFVNIFLAAIKIIVGYMFNSQLLIADGVHSASDLLTDIFAIVGLHIAKKPKDDAHPFGHGNLEYVTSLIASGLIFLMAYELVHELIDTWDVVATGIDRLVFGVSILTFFVKLVLSHYVLYQAKQLDSHTLRSSGLESLTDAYSTILVIIGLLITDLGVEHAIQWMMYAEKAATIMIILMLVKAAWEIFFNSIVGIAGAHAPEEVGERYFALIKEYVVEHEKIFSITEFIVLKQGIDYGIFIGIAFKVDMPLQEAESYIAHIKNMFDKDARVVKTNVEFTTTF